MNKHQMIDVGQGANAEPRYRFFGRMSPNEHQRTPAKAEIAPTSDGNVAVMRIYDPIDSWGDIWGVSAKEVVAALDDLGDGIDTLQVRINSPGGEATEGVAIYNALVHHPAKVDVIVDGLAASAASVVAMAGDTITMLTGTQMMIHDAWALSVGNADDMRATAGMLDAMSDAIASVYCEQASGSKKSWRDAMQKETWYSPDEAVSAGLATKVGKKPKSDSNASFDLSMFKHEGRNNAPAPLLDTNISKSGATVASNSPETQEKAVVNQEELAESIGLAKDATEEEIQARLSDLVKNEKTDKGAKEDPEKPETPEPQPEGETDKTETPEAPAAPAAPEAPAPAPAPDTVVVDKAQHEAVQARVAKLEAEAERRVKAEVERERDSYIANAMKDGKFRAAQKADYEAFWDSNPAAAKAAIDRLAKNTIPVEEIGHSKNSEGVEDDSYPIVGLSPQERKAINEARGKAQ